MKKVILNWLGERLMMLARLCYYKAGGSKHCWICGRAPGMGPIWNGAMTCEKCWDEWIYFYRRGIKIDWKGLGYYKFDSEGNLIDEEGNIVVRID